MSCDLTDLFRFSKKLHQFWDNGTLPQRRLFLQSMVLQCSSWYFTNLHFFRWITSTTNHTLLVVKKISVIKLDTKCLRAVAHNIYINHDRMTEGFLCLFEQKKSSSLGVVTSWILGMFQLNFFMGQKFRSWYVYYVYHFYHNFVTKKVNFKDRQLPKLSYHMKIYCQKNVWEIARMLPLTDNRYIIKM